MDDDDREADFDYDYDAGHEDRLKAGVIFMESLKFQTKVFDNVLQMFLKNRKIF